MPHAVTTGNAIPRKPLQRDVFVSATPGRAFGQRLGQLATGVCRIDCLVDHADLDGGVHPAGQLLVFGGELLVQLIAFVLRGGG